MLFRTRLHRYKNKDNKAFLIRTPKDYSGAEEAWHLNLQTSEPSGIWSAF